MIMKKSCVSKRGKKEEQKGKGKQKNEDNEDEKTEDDEFGKRENNS